MAQTKVKLVSNGVITVDNLHTNHGITTDHIGEGTNKFFTDARVQNYLASNNYIKTTDVASLETTTSLSLNANVLSYVDETGTTTNIDLSLYLDDTNLARLVSGTLDGATGIATFTRDDATTFTVDLSSLTPSETDPVFTASAASGITSTNISNWNTAYGWGNHASAGYLTTVPAPLTSFSTSAWAGGGGYPGYTFVGSNSRFGFSSTTGVVDIYTDGNFYATDSSHLVWHAGNDGSGSGLDADTVDGIHASSFVDKTRFLNRKYSIPSGGGNVSFSGGTLSGTKRLIWLPVGDSGSEHINLETTSGGSDGWSITGITPWSIVYIRAQDSWFTSGDRISVQPSGVSKVSYTSYVPNENDLVIGVYNGDYDAFFTSWGEILTNGSSRNTLRSTIFYDSNDTGYYIDPNSTSQSARFRSKIYIGSNNTWGAFLQVGGDGREYVNNASVASVVTTNGNLHLDSASGYDTYINFYDGANTYFGNGNNAIRITFTSAGAATFSGDVTANASDERLKENIQIIDSPIDKVKQLKGVNYSWKSVVNELGFEPSKTNDVGVLAQDVERVLPEAVRPAPFDTDQDGNSKSGDNYLTVQYEKIVPLLIEAIKEQQQQIEELKQLINK